MLVKMAPTNMPRRGLEKEVSRLIKAGLPLRGATAELMACMPYMSTAKPSIISPRWWLDCPELNILSIIPITATTAVIVDVDSRETQPLPSRLERQIIQPVTLVPIKAPRMIEMAWLSFIMPELTKPTTITEVAEEDCITAVTPAPSSSPRIGVPDRRYSTSSSLLPATFLSPSPIRVIPKRKRATPPRSEITFEIFSLYISF